MFNDYPRRSWPPIASNDHPHRLHRVHVHQLPLDGSEHVSARRNQRAFNRFVRVRLYTDGIGEPYDSQQRLEERLFGTVALPLYAVVDASGRSRAIPRHDA